MTDASQPWDGVPLHPEREGWHLLQPRDDPDAPPDTLVWLPDRRVWRYGLGGHYEPASIIYYWTYIGPLYTQAEADAIRAEERQKAFEEAAKIAAAVRAEYERRHQREWGYAGSSDARVRLRYAVTACEEIEGTICVVGKGNSDVGD